MTRVLKWAGEETLGTFALIGMWAVTFTPEDINAMVISVTALIAAIGVVITNIMMARRMTSKMDAVGSRVEEIKIEAAEIKTETKEIKGHVNSAAAASAATIDALQKQVATLIQQAAESERRAVLLAQSTALGQSATAKPGPTP